MKSTTEQHAGSKRFINILRVIAFDESLQLLIILLVHKSTKYILSPTMLLDEDPAAVSSFPRCINRDGDPDGGS